jgi:hypothetical protein
VTNTWVVNGATGPSGGGIWGYGGLSADPAGTALYAATGNALGASQNAGLSERVVRLTPSLGVVASDAPSLVGRDVDFGATPTLYPASGVPSGCLAAMNKSGALFVYARGAIKRGYRQRLQMGNIKLADHGDFIGNPAFDPTLRLLYVNVPVPASPYVRGIVALRVASNCTLSTAWQHATAPNVFLGDYPSITPTVANGVVYVMRSNNSVAYAFDAAKGTQLWSSGTQITGLIYTAASGERPAPGRLLRRVGLRLRALNAPAALHGSLGDERHGRPAPSRSIRLFLTHQGESAGRAQPRHVLARDFTPFRPPTYHRNAAVRTGASHKLRSSSSSAVTVSEQPAMSSEVQ